MGLAMGGFLQPFAVKVVDLGHRVQHSNCAIRLTGDKIACPTRSGSVERRAPINRRCRLKTCPTIGRPEGRPYHGDRSITVAARKITCALRMLRRRRPSWA